MYHVWLPRALAVWLILSLVIVLVVDMVALFGDTPKLTVSYMLYVWGKKYPALYLLIGLALGHIVFALIVPNGTD